MRAEVGAGGEPVIAPKDYYIAYGEAVEIKSFKGTIMAKDGEKLWLAYADGYPALSTSKTSAHNFSTSSEIRAQAHKWDGMPWFHRMKPGSLHIIKIEHRPVEKIVLVPVEVPQ
jgi:hypothetical protein